VIARAGGFVGLGDEIGMIGGGVCGNGGDVNRRDDVILQSGKTAFQKDGGSSVGDWYKYAAEQITVADKERDTGGHDQADAANRGGRFEESNRPRGRARK